MNNIYKKEIKEKFDKMDELSKLMDTQIEIMRKISDNPISLIISLFTRKYGNADKLCNKYLKEYKKIWDSIKDKEWF